MTTQPEQLVDDTAIADDDDRVHCAVCGVKGEWIDGQVINREGRSVPALCSWRPTRAHGPWLPGWPS